MENCKNIIFRSSPKRNKKELKQALEELKEQYSDYLSSMHEAKQFLSECSNIEESLTALPAIDENQNYESLIAEPYRIIKSSTTESRQNKRSSTKTGK